MRISEISRGKKGVIFQIFGSKGSEYLTVTYFGKYVISGGNLVTTSVFEG